MIFFLVYKCVEMQKVIRNINGYILILIKAQVIHMYRSILELVSLTSFLSINFHKMLIKAPLTIYFLTLKSLQPYVVLFVIQIKIENYINVIDILATVLFNCVLVILHLGATIRKEKLNYHPER